LNTYAIVQTGSKQYRVQAGDKIRVESLPVYTGEIVNIDDVLMVSQDGDVKVGTPVVDGARVRAQVTSRGRGRKITVFKYKSKVRYRRTKGHRQHYTDLRIIDISMDGESLDAVEERMASLDEAEETADIVESDVAVDTESVAEEAADETEDDAPVAEDDQAVEDDATDNTPDESEDDVEDDAPVAESDQADGDDSAEDTPDESTDEPEPTVEPANTDEAKEARRPSGRRRWRR
jgi:large subunit ribosomal protein L21